MILNDTTVLCIVVIKLQNLYTSSGKSLYLDIYIMCLVGMHIK